MTLPKILRTEEDVDEMARYTKEMLRKAHAAGQEGIGMLLVQTSALPLVQQRKLLYDDLILNIDTCVGVHITRILEQMIMLRHRMAMNVRTEINGVRIFVCRDDQTVESLHQEYREASPRHIEQLFPRRNE